VTRLAAVDAQSFWMSAKIPNDQFLLYAFAGVPDDMAAVTADLRDRAAQCSDLRLRIADGSRMRYPEWVEAAVAPTQFMVHSATGLDWTGCLDAVAALADRQLDARLHTWRLHVFAPVTGAPGRSDPVTVAVVQMVHAVADGTRASQLAAWLFGRHGDVPPVEVGRRGSLVLRSISADRAHRKLSRDIASGAIAPPPPSRPPLLSNSVPTGPRRVRTLIRDRSSLPQGMTVTVAALVAIGSALADYLRARGEDPAQLGAEVPMRKPGIRRARNHFRNIGVGLWPAVAPPERAARIEADLRAGQVRAEHPAQLTAARSFAAVPAVLLRWGVAQFDATVRAPAVTGNTVVSSINRGPADLYFGAAPVIMTAGYPALSPMMALTHGVHGIGETIAVSVHCAAAVIDIDEYVERLEHALSSSRRPSS
jgi:hypothetical protein